MIHLEVNKELNQLRKEVCKAARDESFIHHLWFVEYHLNIVYKITVECSEYYPKADLNIMKAIVWLHDYGKILDFDDQWNRLFTDGRNLLERLQFQNGFIETTMAYLDLFERKMDIENISNPN